MADRTPVPYGRALHKLAVHAKLDIFQAAILHALADRLGGKDHAWPSYALLARESHQSRRKAIMAVKTLQGLGILIVDDSGASNCYTIDFDVLLRHVKDEQVRGC